MCGGFLEQIDLFEDLIVNSISAQLQKFLEDIQEKVENLASKLKPSFASSYIENNLCNL